MPRRTVWPGSTLGDHPPICASSDGSGPSNAASGIPWTLPLGEVAGVFMSPCASIQSRPIGSALVDPGPLGRRRDRTGGEAVIAAEHERQRAFLERDQRRLVQLFAHRGDVVDVFLALVAPFLRFGNRRLEIAPIDDGAAKRREALVEPGNAKRRRPHVDAAAAAAKIQGHADDVDAHAWRARTAEPSLPFDFHRDRHPFVRRFDDRRQPAQDCPESRRGSHAFRSPC